MSYTKSNLGSEKYGYDYVVATTQGSINATMKAYLRGLKSEPITRCYCYDDKGNIVKASLDDIIKKTGQNPFGISAGTDVSDPRIKALSDAGFAYGFIARIGVPPGYASADIPNMVVLNPGTPGSAKFTLMCAEFTVVELTYGPRGATKWFFAQQESGKAWLFTSKIDLKNFDVEEKYHEHLPNDVKNALKNFNKGTFSVQQMLFDFTSAVPENLPTIIGVESGTQLHTCLEREFLDRYFAELKYSGEPVLGYSISFKEGQDGTLNTTGIKHMAEAYVDDKGSPVSEPTIQQQKKQTYCYLCATENHIVSNPTQFGWNWIDDSSEAHGAIAINRKTYAYYLAYNMTQKLSRYCYTPTVSVYTGTDLITKFSWKLEGGGYPQLAYQPTGDDVLKFSWHKESSDQSGVGGCIGSLTLTQSLDVTVSFKDTQIVVVQHLVVWCKVTEEVIFVAYGNIVDLKITDTFTFAVNEKGTFEVKINSEKEDHSKKFNASDFDKKLGTAIGIIKNIQDFVSPLVSIEASAVSYDAIRNFVFPGGSSFVFKEARFSDYRDLVTHITYANPKQQVNDMLEQQGDDLPMRSPICTPRPS